jgi:hypothetical protein
MPAGGGIVEYDSLAGPQVRDRGTERDDLPGDLVTGEQGVSWPELSLVQVQVRAAHAGEQDADEHLVRAGNRIWHFAHGKGAWPVIDDRLHLALSALALLAGSPEPVMRANTPRP